MRTRAERRNLRNKKIKIREDILNSGGFNDGVLYEKQRTKIEKNGSGYMSKSGTLLHYAKGTKPASQKTRNRNSYDGTNNWSAHDKRQIDSMNEAELEEMGR